MELEMERKSSSYVFTADVNSVSDMEKLEAIKQAVRVVNKTAYINKRVVLRGRKPLKKKEVFNFYTDQKSVRSYDFGGNIVGGIANATMIDVYIYDRY